MPARYAALRSIAREDFLNFLKGAVMVVTAARGEMSAQTDAARNCLCPWCALRPWIRFFEGSGRGRVSVATPRAVRNRLARLTAVTLTPARVAMVMREAVIERPVLLSA